MHRLRKILSGEDGIFVFWLCVCAAFLGGIAFTAVLADMIKPVLFVIAIGVVIAGLAHYSASIYERLRKPSSRLASSDDGSAIAPANRDHPAAGPFIVPLQSTEPPSPAA